MMSNATIIEQTVATLNHDIKEKIQEAYELGFQEGLNITLPTQKEFHRDHRTPRKYGSDREWLVVSAEYNEKTALKKMCKVLRDKWGWTDAAKMPTELYSSGVTYKRTGGEIGYHLDLHNNGVWTAWVWEIE